MGTIIVLPETTRQPITLIGQRAGICWNADTSDAKNNYQRGLDCIQSGHLRTTEFVNVELVIEGYSARVIREYYTHIYGYENNEPPTRLQASTRYINYSDFDYVTPESIRKLPAASAIYDLCMSQISQNIADLVRLYDIPREDVALLLPLGMTTKMVDKRVLRSFIDMSRQRKCQRANWEFRDMFSDIEKALFGYSDEWKWVVENCFYPKCAETGVCREKKGCGMYPKASEME